MGFYEKFQRARIVSALVGFVVVMIFALKRERLGYMIAQSPAIAAYWSGIGLTAAVVAISLTISMGICYFLLKCPACNGYVGYGQAPKFCRNCGAPLK